MQLNQDTCFNSSTNSSLNFNFNNSNNVAQFARPQRVSMCGYLEQQNASQSQQQSQHAYLSRKNSLSNKRNEFEKRRESMNRFSTYNPDKYSRSVIEGNGSTYKRQNTGPMDRQRNMQTSESESDDTKSLLLSEFNYEPKKKNPYKSQMLLDKNKYNSEIHKSNESLINNHKRQMTIHTNKENNYDNHSFYNNNRGTLENELSSVSHSTMNRGSVRNTLNINNPGYYPNLAFQKTMSRCSNANSSNPQDDSQMSVLTCNSKHIYVSRPTNLSISPSNSTDSIDLARSSRVVRKKILLDGGSVLKKSYLSHGVENIQMGNNTYYSKDYLKPNIKMGEIENSNRISGSFDKQYENFAKVTEKKVIKTNYKPTLMTANKANYKTMTMNPSIMRKVYGAKESFDAKLIDKNRAFDTSFDTKLLDKKFDELFIQMPNSHRADKSYSAAEFPDETRLSKNSFGSVMSIPIQMRLEEYENELRNPEYITNKASARLVLGKHHLQKSIEICFDQSFVIILRQKSVS